jgi:hypothetical protein
MIGKKTLLMGIGLAAGVPALSANTKEGGCFICKTAYPGCEVDEHMDYIWPPNNWHGGQGAHGTECFEWYCEHVHTDDYYIDLTAIAEVVNTAKALIAAEDDEGVARLLEENDFAYLNPSREALQIRDPSGTILYHVTFDQERFKRIAALVK